MWELKVYHLIIKVSLFKKKQLASSELHVNLGIAQLINQRISFGFSVCNVKTIIKKTKNVLFRPLWNAPKHGRFITL